MWKDLPNIITKLRIAAILPVVVSFYVSSSFLLFFLIIASVSDIIDGKLARMYKAHSDFGMYLDSLADKLLVITTLFMMAGFGYLSNLNIIPAVLVVIREIVIGSLPRLRSSKFISRLKTVMQMVSICFLAGEHGGIVADRGIGIAALWISAVLALITAIQYLLFYNVISDNLENL